MRISDEFACLFIKKLLKNVRTHVMGFLINC